ncbi:YqeB family protein, partial [Georgenia thermotolerans]
MLPSTTVRPPRGVRLALRLGYPLAGLLLFLAITLAVEAAAQASDSFDGILGRADHVGEPVALVVAGALGTLLGVVWSSSVLAEALRAQVGVRAITLTWDDARVSVPRTLVEDVVVGADVVLLGAGTVELARVRCDLDRPTLLTALTDHGYPTPRAEDPHEEVFTPWERTAQDLPRQERRLLGARAEALTDGAHGDAELLRRQLAARGVMVRDVHRPGRRARVQEWRVIPEAVPALSASAARDAART